MEKNFKIGDRIRVTSNHGDEEYFKIGETGTVIEPSYYAYGSAYVQFDNRPGTDGQWYVKPDQCEVISGQEIKVSVVEKVDNAIWFNKIISSDESFKSKPGYALAAVVKVLLAKGVLTPSDFDLLTLEESAVTTVPANKD